MSASTIQFVSTNLINCFEQIGVSVGVLKCSDGSRDRYRIPLPRHGTKRVDLLELRQLKILFNGKSLVEKSSAVKRATGMVTQEYVARYAMQATGVTNTLAYLWKSAGKIQVQRTVIPVGQGRWRVQSPIKR
jgi:hypothetical protein